MTRSGARAALAVLAATAFATSTAWGATTEVGVNDNFFSPRNPLVVLGNQVHWSRASGSVGNHNVRQNGKIFFSGPPTVGVINLTVTFGSAGAYHYYCEIHGSSSGGMDGYVRVPIKLATAPSGLPFTVRWATGTSTGSRFDVQYRVGSSTTWKTWKSATTAFYGVFGKSNVPVTVRSGVTYTFRARSRKVVSGATVSSAYSPTKSFKP